MSIMVCAKCEKYVDTDFDDMHDDGENDPICMPCFDEWEGREIKDAWALYQGARLAGLIGDKEGSA